MSERSFNVISGSHSTKMDEVEGRTTEASDVGSAPTMFCNTCPGVNATAFCVDCHEYLCTDCTGYHQRLKLTKTHTLLTGDEFTSGSPPQRQDDQTECIRRGSDHSNEKIKFYCQGHSALCCVTFWVKNELKCTYLTLLRTSRMDISLESLIQICRILIC